MSDTEKLLWLANKRLNHLAWKQQQAVKLIEEAHLELYGHDIQLSVGALKKLLTEE